MSASSNESSPPDWFKIESYVTAKDLDFRGWATQIGNRFYLGALFSAAKEFDDVDKFVEFDKHIAQLIENPFTDLGFSSSYPSDNTLYPLTFGVAKTFTKVLAEANCGDDDFCDEKLRELHPDMYAGQAHLFVNLRAPKNLLKKQFSDWLEKSHLKRKREPAITESVTQIWAVNHPIFPYQDLNLWYKRQGWGMPKDSVMAHWLGLDESDRDVIRQVREKAASVFTINGYCDLIFSASEPPPP